jgi:splicing factor 3A subunit 2
MSGREFGSKPGSGGVASGSNSNADRRERLRQLALETIDLLKDPYFLKNHLGSYECKLCLTLHNNEGSYLAHTQGRRHQMNISRRAAKDNRDVTAPTPLQSATGSKVTKTKKVVRIGRPGYKVIKERDDETNQLGLTFMIDYPEIERGIRPRYRFMSAFEQKVEPTDKNYQYILFAAEPYETVAFKIPNKDIEKNLGPTIPGESKFWTKWDDAIKQFSLQLHFKPQPKGGVVYHPHPPKPNTGYDPMQPKTTPNVKPDNVYFNK